MTIEVCTLQLKKTAWATDLCQEYCEKISHFHQVEMKFVKSEDKMIERASPQDWIILCDETGEAPTSRGLAKKIDQWLNVSSRKIVFVVGGPFGVSAQMKERANFRLQLSSLVLNQQVALTVLMEQLFRSFTIINNHPYHND